MRQRFVVLLRMGVKGVHFVKDDVEDDVKDEKVERRSSRRSQRMGELFAFLCHFFRVTIWFQLSMLWRVD